MVDGPAGGWPARAGRGATARARPAGGAAPQAAGSTATRQALAPSQAGAGRPVRSVPFMPHGTAKAARGWTSAQVRFTPRLNRCISDSPGRPGTARNLRPVVSVLPVYRVCRR